MKRYSNPASLFVTGGGLDDIVEFTYERDPSRSQPFHLFIRTEGHIVMSAMVFAYDTTDVKCVFWEYLEWLEKHIAIALQYLEGRRADGNTDHRMASIKSKVDKLNFLKKVALERSMDITQIDKNQLFKLSCAGNDTW